MKNMICSRLCILRNRLSQCRLVCEWLNMTITMLLSVIELSFAIQDEPRVYHENSAVVDNENVIIFRRLLCLKLRQMNQLVMLVETGCNTCRNIQIPPRDPTV
jgi:hypothetical protein